VVCKPLLHWVLTKVCACLSCCCPVPAVCVAGYGKATGSNTCTMCGYGSFQPGGDITCATCPSTAFYTPVDGAGQTYTSTGTTFYQGSFGQEACVPVRSQLSPEAGQAYIAADSTAFSLLGAPTAADSLTDCVESCPADKCCMAQYDVTGKACYKVLLEPVSSEASSGRQLLYKLPPSTLGSASSVEEPKAGAKMMSSGYYAHCTIPANTATTWEAAGSDLGNNARTFVKAAAWTGVQSKDDCKKACDNSNVCWGFVYDAAEQKCSFRGGVDAIATRSFFALPTGVANLAALKW